MTIDNITIFPAIMAGGSGSRLWPLSRKSYPKQFVSLHDEHSLFQNTAKRFMSSDNISFNAPVILTTSRYRFIACEQMLQVGIDPGCIILEPAPKNTASSILVASLQCLEVDPEAIILAAPSDHIIEDDLAFLEAIRRGITELNSGKIVTFGITPTFASTGYGYLKCEEILNHHPTTVLKFIEKPDKQLAQKMLDSEKFLWNSGIFLFRAADMVSAFQRVAPDYYDFVRASLDNAHSDLGFLRLEEEAWAKLKNESIDYAIMEKITNISVVPFSGAWSDLGDWDSVWRCSEKSNDGMVMSRNSLSLDCKNTMLKAEGSDQVVVGIGLENIVAIAMPDAVLVAHKDKSQDVKEIVNRLHSGGHLQAESLPRDYRPWGWYDVLTLSERFQVKRICVKSSASLSLQSHHHRSEHWIVVEGTAKVTVGKEVKLLTEGQSIYVPLGEMHRLENPGKLPLILIEVQTGSYLGEDDIIRYDDIYART